MPFHPYMPFGFRKQSCVFVCVICFIDKIVLQMLPLLFSITLIIASFYLINSGIYTANSISKGMKFVKDGSLINVKAGSLFRVSF